MGVPCPAEGHLEQFRGGVAQGEGTARAVASDYERNLKQHGLVKLVAMDAVRRQGAVPEAGEHKRIWRLTLRRVEFGHGGNC